MSSQKSELRANVIAEIGNRLEDQMEAAKAESSRFDGAKQALLQAAKKVEEHTRHVQLDIEAGKYDDLKHAEREKKRILECMGILQNLAVGAEVNFHSSRGKVEALEQAVKAIKQSYDAELSRARTLREAEEKEKALIRGELSEEPLAQSDTERGVRRVVGTHPGPSISQRRRDVDVEKSSVVPDSSTEVVTKRTDEIKSLEVESSADLDYWSLTAPMDKPATKRKRKKE